MNFREYILESEIKVRGKDFPTIEQAREYLKDLGVKPKEIEKQIELGRHILHSKNLRSGWVRNQNDPKVKKKAAAGKYDWFDHNNSEDRVKHDLQYGKLKKSDVDNMKRHSKALEDALDNSKSVKKDANGDIKELKDKIADMTKRLHAAVSDDNETQIYQLEDGIAEYKVKLKKLEAKK